MPIRAPQNEFTPGFGPTDPGWNNYLNQQDQIIGTGLGVGGGAGVGVIFNNSGIDNIGGGGNAPGYIPIVQQPNLPNSDIQYTFRIDANLRLNTSLYIDGENTYKNLPTAINYKISEILNSGQKTLTVKNSIYNCNQKFVIDIVNNPNYQNQNITTNQTNSNLQNNSGGIITSFEGLQFQNSNININVNPYESLFNYQNRQQYTEQNYLESSQLTFTNIPAFTIRVRKYEGDTLVNYENELDIELGEYERGIKFSLIPAVADPDDDVLTNPTLPSLKSLEIYVNGGSDQVSLIYTKNKIPNEILLKEGINAISVEDNLEDSYSIQSANLQLYRISSINFSGITIRNAGINAENINESVSTSFTSNDIGNSWSSITVNTEQTVIINNPIPNVYFINPDYINSDEFRIYNKNSNSGVFIALGCTDSDNIKVFVADKEFNYPVKYNNNNLDVLNEKIIEIPQTALQNIGTYKIRILPSNKFGNGNYIETLLNVVDDVYVKTPDITNIIFPATIKGPDYVGTNVDFNISYSSVNTDFIRLYVESKENVFTQLSKSGNQKFNFQELLNLGKVTTNEEDDFISLKLILTPYNTSGRETIVGKDEIISIQFDKGDLEIPRELAISRIAEAFISQFDESLFADETSKYLTHLLHLGSGDNKVITTWQGDNDSLILKLYEPLPTAVQPNQQVWISKIQANPIIETITISGIDTSFCAPLKGPNFSVEADNGIGFQVFDDLISSGSKIATDIYNAIGEKTTIDTTKLNIQYVSASVYTFDNFVHFGSAYERVENFYYKIKLLEQYQTKYISLVQTAFPIGYVLTEDAGGIATPELDGDEILNTENGLDIQYEIPQVLPAPFAQIEAQKLSEKISNLIKSFDGFENFLFKSENNLAYPKEDLFDFTTSLTYRVIKSSTSNAVKSWLAYAQNEAEFYDKYNPYAIKNNLPEYIFEDYQNADFLLFCDMIGQHFDILWAYINGLKTIKKLEHTEELGIPNDIIAYLLKSLGWDVKKAFNSQFLWEYLFGRSREGAQKYGRSLQDANYEIWRRILNNLPYLLKHKGTGRALKAIMACYGVPQSMLTIMEFGGPQDPTAGGSSKFTFDDRTAAIYLASGSGVKIPWKYHSPISSYPNAIEFRVKPADYPSNNYTLISGSEWSLDLERTTGSFAKLQLNFGGDASGTSYIAEPFVSASVSTFYFDTASFSPYLFGVDFLTSSLGFPISLDDYSNVIINRYNYAGSTSQFEVWLATGNGSRITTFVSMSIITEDTQWETGSFIHIGSDKFVGNVDEVRLWTEPLSRSKFENHTLFPDAINGNQFNSSTEHLLFRLDFEYPKDRTKTENNGIINVAVSDNYGEPNAFVHNQYSASNYPYQYTPYDRTVTATVPSLGFNYSNKIRFESSSLIGDLSYKIRATKKSFDRAPIDSSRLGLFFSPIKELNMDIVKTFGDFNIDNYIGDPSDEYKETYKQLDNLRHYYFERLDRDIYEYIQLVRYVDKSLFDVLADLAPARAKISKGLLIEPHYLERSKTRWDKPVSEKNNYDSNIIVNDDDRINLENIYEETTLDLNNSIELQPTYDTNETIIDIDDLVVLDSEKTNFEGIITNVINNELEAETPFYNVSISVPSGSTLIGEVDVFKSEEIGTEKDSLSNLGYGLYGKYGMIVYRRWDGIFGNLETTGSRKFAYVVKEQKSKKVNTQISGYPTNGAQPGDAVKYSLVTNYYNKSRISILSTGSISLTSEIIEVTPLNGYLPTHYKFVNNLSEGLQRSYFKGSQQTSATTPDGLEPVETFTTNPNILRVAKTGRGSGEPILEVD